jgi:hypothetical protein
VSRAVIPHFIRQRSGAFVHLTSSSGLFGRREQAHYAAAKLGVTAMSRTMAMEYAHAGIRSNCVGPISFSRMVEGTAISAEAMSAFRKLSPDQIAPIIAYLCSDLASSVTGQVFYVCGNELFFIEQCQSSPPLVELEGWTLQKIHERGMPAFASHFGALRGTEETIIHSTKLG